MAAETVAAQSTAAAPGTLGIGSQPVPQDLFAFIGDWRQVGKTVERDSTQGVVSVSTFVDRWEKPDRKAVCAEFPFINDEPVNPREQGELYDRILESADGWIDDHQGDLFESWGAR